MKKRLWLPILLSMILGAGSAVTAHAEILPAQGGRNGRQAVVLCESLPVYRERSADSGAVDTLRYGDTLIVQSVRDGWAACFLSDAVDAVPSGWVNAYFVVIDPAWYRTDQATPVYAWNDTLAPRVALLGQGTTLPILKDEGEWLIVSLRGAAGWIRKSAADRTGAGTAAQLRNLSGLEKAELTTPGGSYTLSDEAGLRWLGENFSAAQPTGGTGCPFDATLTLYPAGGEPITLRVATDSCCNFRTGDGSFFSYGNREEALRLYGSTSVIGETFWRLFGITNTYEGIYGP